MFGKNFKNFQEEDSAAHHWQTKASSGRSPFSNGFSFGQLLRGMGK